MSENSETQGLEKSLESFFSAAWEKLFDYGMETMKIMDDYKIKLETLETSLKSLTAKASDVKEHMKNGELSRKKKRKRRVENWLKEVEEIESELVVLQNELNEQGFLNQFFGNEDRVEKLNGRISELVEESGHFEEQLFFTCATGGEPLLTTGVTGKAFEKNVEKIWKWLVNDKVPNIGILGMGGVGKTTLARHINKQLINETKCCVYWVAVSQVVTINKLQDDMAKLMGLDLSDEDDEDKRAGKLNQALSQSKDIVLILDNVWDSISLEKLGDPLGIQGCRLIVTTRSLNVCRQIGCKEIIKVETLETDEAWNLFREMLGKRTAVTSEVEEIAKFVVKECDGLPLGIIILARSMNSHVTDIHEWRNIYDEICGSPMKQDGMQDKVFRVLKYSFNRLDSEFHRKRRRRNGYTKLQLCFLYCSLYPENYEIEKDELIRKFISEELVDTRKSWEKQLDQGYAMLSKLVNLCLLEHFSQFDDSFERVKMHDLVRDMALKIARESPQYKIFAGLGLEEIPNEEEWTENIDKISLMSNEIEEIPRGMAPNCPKLATLLLNENPLKSIPESFFARMSNLRILDLSHTLIEELPDSLFDLGCLNALLLRYCDNLIAVPYLGKLKALRELDLSWTSIEEIPKGIENLINLKILLFRRTMNLKLQPGDLSLISPFLQDLELPLAIEAPVHEIERFKQLNRFVGRFKDVSDFNWFQSQTRELISNFSCHVGNVVANCDEYLSSMDTNMISMGGCDLRRGEGEDTEIILPEKFQLLEIIKCKGLSSRVLDDFKPYSSVIEDLTIDDCEGIESIWNLNDQLMAETIVNVVCLNLSTLPDLKGLVNWEVGGGPPPPQAAKLFSSLQKLYIYNCNKMKTLGLPLPCLHDIRDIEVQSCTEMEELIELVEVAEDDNGISEPTESLPNLERLTLLDLPKLKSICKARVDCKSIEKIEIRMCPRVQKLHLFLPSSSSSSSSSYGQVINYSPPPALKMISIEKERWESLEWDYPTHKHLLQPFVKY